MSSTRLLAVWTSGQEFDDPSLNTAAPLHLARGASVVIQVDLVDSATRRPVDLDIDDGDELVLSVSQTFASGAVLTRKARKTGFAAYELILAPEDTIDLSGRLVYDVWVKRGGASQQVVAPSYFNVSPRVKE